MAAWCVYKTAFGATYRDPVVTFGPFDSKAAAEAFAKKNGGTIYDHSALTPADREVLGIYD